MFHLMWMIYYNIVMDQFILMKLLILLRRWCFYKFRRCILSPSAIIAQVRQRLSRQEFFLHLCLPLASYANMKESFEPELKAFTGNI